MSEWDVIVVGSGAGAMTAAVRAHDLGLKTLVLEKSDKFGGTSAVSGGGIWIPVNPQMPSVGREDNFEDAWTYVMASTKGQVPEVRLRAYMDNGAPMLKYLAEKTRLSFRAVGAYPDYYQHLPGVRPGGRTMEPDIFDRFQLGDAIKDMRGAERGGYLFGRMNMDQTDAAILMGRKPGWFLHAAKIVMRYVFDIGARVKGKRDRRMTMGQAMVASLRTSMLDRDMPLWLNTKFTGLTTEDWRVTGVTIERNGKPQTLTAKRAVILAAGGFEANQEMRTKYLPNPTQANWSASPTPNTGDAIQAGMAIGAATEFMDKAWWTPVVEMPNGATADPVITSRAGPGCVIVNKKGKRFANEAMPYLEFGEAHYADNDAGNQSIPAWIIFDAGFRKQYPVGPLYPSVIMPDSKLPPEWEGQLYWRANDLDALADLIGVDKEGLRGTIARTAEYAKTGKDLEFDKGGNIYDRYYGDANNKPNPCLRALDQGPFYAMKLVPGDIGTKGGLKADEYARVIAESGEPIQGLYAIGNCSSPVMGPGYPGPGSTLGPAMVMGYVAAGHIAGANAA